MTTVDLVLINEQFTNKWQKNYLSVLETNTNGF